MSDLIAQSSVQVLSPAGEEHLGLVGLGRPMPQKTGEFGCFVMLPLGESRMVFGADSLQALALALRFLADRLNALLAAGFRLSYPESEEAIPFDAYFLHPAFLSRLEALGEISAKTRAE